MSHERVEAGRWYCRRCGLRVVNVVGNVWRHAQAMSPDHNSNCPEKTCGTNPAPWVYRATEQDAIDAQRMGRRGYLGRDRRRKQPP